MPKDPWANFHAAQKRRKMLPPIDLGDGETVSIPNAPNVAFVLALHRAVEEHGSDFPNDVAADLIEKAIWPDDVREKVFTHLSHEEVLSLFRELLHQWGMTVPEQVKSAPPKRRSKE
jgi:hypothetical protein